MQGREALTSRLFGVLVHALLLLGFFCCRADGQSNQWAWVSGGGPGALEVDQPGAYGQQGVFAATNAPGARESFVTWTDQKGNLWLFGGLGQGTPNGAIDFGLLNDLWEFSPSRNEWVWMSGSNSVPVNCFGEPVCAPPGTYGTLKTPSSGNMPGGREGGASWTDKNGNLWLFGGTGPDAAGNQGWLNDLWEFIPSTNQWAWMGGSSTIIARLGGEYGVYGTLGVQATTNIPGGRTGAVTWADSSGNLWLSGPG